MKRQKKANEHSFIQKNEPYWYKDAIIYEVHVRAFYDSDGNGIGDFSGLTQKLDYLKDLGITAIWLLPFYPSPLRDDGYDISDYFNVHPDYGTLHDFKLFLNEAHQKGIRIIIELCLNHTSDQHPWFQKARNSKNGSKWRNFYVWSDSVEKYREARIIFKDFESSNWSWDPVAEAYYWHRFYSHQPDLNYLNPAVQKAIFKIVHFWFDLGVDGMRLDAVPYLFEREGTNCENLPETHQFLKKLRTYVDENFVDKMLLAEANQWPEDAAQYFGDGDEAHMAYHFPLMPRLFLSLRMEDSYPIIDILQQTPSIPDSCQWGMFLRNHDELTLEMVTDEERDYMYQVYAKDPHQRINLGIRRRLAPLMRDDRREIELMNVLLFSLPGTAILYYGDEIGMGDNYYLGDRNGVRTPMQWNSDINAGFSRSNPQQLYLPVIIDPEYHYLAVNVQNQQRNPSSFLWWIKRLIAITKRYLPFSRGSITFLNTKNPKVLGFIREFQEDKILVIVNLAKSSQFVQLDLAGYTGIIPVEIFSGNKFPQIREDPYTLTLGPHDYYWFQILEKNTISSEDFLKEIPLFKQKNSKISFVNSEDGKKIEEILLSYINKWTDAIPGRRGKGNLTILEHVPLGTTFLSPSDIILLKISYQDGTSRIIFLPVILVIGDEAQTIIQEVPQYVITRFLSGEKEGIICESYFDRKFRENVLSILVQRKMFRGCNGTFRILIDRKYRNLLKQQMTDKVPLLHAGKGTCHFIISTNGLSLKLYRTLEEGMNPAIDIVRFLNEETFFQNCPVHVGSVQYKQPSGESYIIGIIQDIPEKIGTGISFSENAVTNFYNTILSKREELTISKITPEEILKQKADQPLIGKDVITPFCLHMMDMLGRRTGEMHLALASSQRNPDFNPEPFSLLYQRSLYQAFQSQIRIICRNLNTFPEEIPKEHYDAIKEFVTCESEFIHEIHPIIKKKVSTLKTRIHGDYHLGNILFSGKDLIMVNFEGEPTKSITERRLKYCPLRDVAGMIWSMHYTAYTIFSQITHIRPEDISVLKPWVDFWVSCVVTSFLSAYLATVGKADFIPDNTGDLDMLLRIYTIERAVSKVDYMRIIRPDRIHIAMEVARGILNRRISVENFVQCG